MLEHPLPEHVRKVLSSVAEEFRKGNHKGARIRLEDIRAVSEDPHLIRALHSIKREIDIAVKTAKRRKERSGITIAEQLEPTFTGFYLLHKGIAEENPELVMHALKYLEGSLVHPSVISYTRKLYSLLTTKEKLLQEIEELRRRIHEHGK